LFLGGDVNDLLFTKSTKKKQIKYKFKNDVAFVDCRELFIFILQFIFVV
jgi:hypothetical protein